MLSIPHNDTVVKRNMQVYHVFLTFFANLVMLIGNSGYIN